MAAVRPLTIEDTAALLALNVSARPHVAPLDASELSRLCALSGAHIVLDDADGALLGYALVFASNDAYDGEEFQRFGVALAAPFTYVDQVVVRAALRGTGVGQRLYEAIAAMARAHGHRWLCCEVNAEPPNPGSLAFHGRCGFHIVGQLATQDGRLVHLMTKRLPATGETEP